MAWNENVLTTASKDFTIKLRDIRAKSNLSVLNFHKEVKLTLTGGRFMKKRADNKPF